MRNKLSIAISLFFFGIASSALAFTPATTTQVQWPDSPMGRALSPTTEFHEFIAYIYEWGISLGGIVVFAMLVWAGIQYLTSAGDPGKMGGAIKKIQSSILGLVLLLTSWLILNTINPQLVRLEPLPQLWDETILPEFDLDLGKMQAPPCDFVVVWPEERFGGNPIKPVKFDSVSDEVKIIEGVLELNEYSRPWASAKGFIKLTPEELELLRRRTIRIERYNTEGKKDPTGLFKEGGSCIMDIFYTTRRWLTSNACGKRLGRVQLPSEDISVSKYRDESITCVEIIRSIPQKVETTPSNISPYDF